VGQVVRNRRITPVPGNRQVAAVDARADLRDGLQTVQVELADPAVARGEVDEAAVRGELRPSVQRVVGLEAVDGLQTVAVWSPSSTTTNRFKGSELCSG